MILSPLGLAILLIALRTVLARKGHQRSVRAISVALAGCLVLMTPFGANSLVYALEDAPSAYAGCASEPQRPLVLLGGGLDKLPASEADVGALTPVSSHRMYGLLQSGLVTPDRMLVISGGAVQTKIPESRVLKHLAVLGKVNPSQITTEELSTSTWENATQTAKLLLKTHSHIALVTSAMHMKRAKAAFEHQGFDVCPVSVDSEYIPPGGLGYWLPQSSALNKAERAIHEWIGVLAYTLRSGTVQQ